ncbi:MAG: hypothetical protein JKY54_10635 [Flavobacteriales bacterium]|nr:hypothetical protein [Flavobacteriales bacterium]
MPKQWEFLKDSYWYVPVAYLPALQISADGSPPTPMVDQTLWHITDYKYGYFWGNSAALLYEEGTSPTDPPSASRLVGTITPQGKVQITFMPFNQLGPAMSTVGIGIMEESRKEWVFEMQMSAGITELVVHWAQMLPTKEGDPSWEQLPGTEYSVPEFLKAAGF